MMVIQMKRLWRTVLVILVFVAVGYGFYSVDHGSDSVLRALVVPVEGTIDVQTASYGLNCAVPEMKWYADKTYELIDECNGRQECTYTVSVEKLGDPAGGCGKDFRIAWLCEPGEEPRLLSVPAEASGTTITIACGATDGR